MRPEPAPFVAGGNMRGTAAADEKCMAEHTHGTPLQDANFAHKKFASQSIRVGGRALRALNSAQRYPASAA